MLKNSSLFFFALSTISGNDRIRTVILSHIHNDGISFRLPYKTKKSPATITVTGDLYYLVIC